MTGLPGLYSEQEENGRNAEKNELLQAASGDLTAFTDIYRRYRDRLYGFICRMTSEPAVAEDLTHDVFLALIEHPERYDPAKGRLFTLLCAIARCRFIDEIRRNGVRTEWDGCSDESALSRPFEESTTTPFDQVLAGELEELVANAVRGLPPLQRETLLLREYEGLSYDEIAVVVNSTPEVVKARLYRARRLLAAQLGQLIRRNGEKEYGLRKSQA